MPRPSGQLEKDDRFADSDVQLTINPVSFVAPKKRTAQGRPPCEGLTIVREVHRPDLLPPAPFVLRLKWNHCANGCSTSRDDLHASHSAPLGMTQHKRRTLGTINSCLYRSCLLSATHCLRLIFLRVTGVTPSGLLSRSQSYFPSAYSPSTSNVTLPSCSAFPL